MQQIKAALLSHHSLAVVVALLTEPLARYPRMRQEDIQTVEIVLAFFRNLLSVPDSVSAYGRDNKSKLQVRPDNDPSLTTLVGSFLGREPCLLSVEGARALRRC